MSNSTLPDQRSALPESLGRSLLDGLQYRARGVAFWSAIALPFLHIPLLVTGLETTTSLAAFVALVLINLTTLYLGQPYAAD